MTARGLVTMTLAVAILAGLLGAPSPLVAAPAAAAQDAEETDAAGVDCRDHVEGLAPHGATGSRDAVLMIHGWTGVPTMWEHPISMTVDQHNRPAERSFAEQVKRFGDTDVWLLDYHRNSGRWVTDERVGGAVARSIDCLFEHYERPIGIAAHSMGGLAVRQVASEAGRAERIAAVVTFGTPHEGSDFARIVAGVLGLTDEHTDTGEVGPIVVELLRACGLLSTSRIGTCDPIPDFIAAFDSEAGRALRSESDELRVLPDYPEGLATTSLAGEVEVVGQVATGGLFYQDLAGTRVGDVVVTSASALARGATGRDWDCRYNLTVDPTPGFVQNAGSSIRSWFGMDEPAGNERSIREITTSPCAHWNLAVTAEVTNEALWFLHEHLRGDGAADPEDDTGGDADDAAEIVRDGASPLVFLVDVSSSMSEDGGAGLSRLDAARDNLTEFLFGLAPGTPVGVRQYPDPAGPDCNAGRTVQPVAPLSASRTVALIDGFRAAGNTPTGTALLAAVDELRASGFTSGEIVLVSDGESNCGEPPCDVVRSIIDTGFDVSVNTFGFVISAEGRQELDCIAGASGGSYFDAADAEELEEQLRAITGAAVAIDVTHPERVPSGMTLPVEVTVTNPSSVLAEDVEVAIGFGDAGPQGTPQTGGPARYRVGNLPPGASVTRRWDVGAGARGQPGSVAASVTAWAADVAPVTDTSEVEVTEELPAIEEVGGLLREVHEDGGTVAIMGDSYSSGEGAGDDLPGTDEPGSRCHRSPHTYAVSLFGEESVDVIACSGAVIEHFYQAQPQRAATPAQLTALDDLGATPDLVLLTIGINDVGFTEFVERCVGPQDCTKDAGWVTGLLRDVALLGPQLEGLYADLAARVQDDGGRVAVLAYPEVLPSRRPVPCTGFTANELVFVDQFVRALNAGVGQAVERVRAEGHDVQFVPQSAQAVLPVNTACHPEPHLVAVDQFEGLERGVTGWLSDHAAEPGAVEGFQGLLHPTIDGYAALTHALIRWSETADPGALGSRVAAEDELADHVIDGAGGTVELQLTAGEVPALRLRRGDRIDLAADGFVPGSRVRVSMGGRPVTLAVLRADAEGRVAGEVHVPMRMATGDQPLRARGLDASAEPRELAANLGVMSPTPAWFWPAAGGALVLALLGGALGVTAWRGRRRPPATRPT